MNNTREEPNIDSFIRILSPNTVNVTDIGHTI